MKPRQKTPVVAIICPCYNEEDALPRSVIALSEVLQQGIRKGLMSENSRLVFVNDGSKDATWHVISRLADTSDYIVGIDLVVNSGHQMALMAGIEVSVEFADAIITIDADLQDDPWQILKMVGLYNDGYDVVYGVRDDRTSDTWFKRFTAESFYKFSQNLGIKMIFNHADYRLISRKAALELLRYEERNLFLRGIIPSMGFEGTTVSYKREERKAGESKYPLKKMIEFAIGGITSSSVKPLRIIGWIGIGFLLAALGILIYVIISLCRGQVQSGWSSLMLSLWFCSGTILLSLSILGEYIAKIYTEVKQRPRYAIREIINLQSSESSK